MLGSLYETGRGFVDGDRSQSDHGQSHATERPGAYCGDPGHETDPDGCAAGQAGEQRSQTETGRRSGLGGCEAVVDGRHVRQPRLGRARDCDFGGACKQFDRGRGQVSSSAGDAPFAATGHEDRAGRNAESYE